MNRGSAAGLVTIKPTPLGKRPLMTQTSLDMLSPVLPFACHHHLQTPSDRKHTFATTHRSVIPAARALVQELIFLHTHWFASRHERWSVQTAGPPLSRETIEGISSGAAGCYRRRWHRYAVSFRGQRDANSSAIELPRNPRGQFPANRTPPRDAPAAPATKRKLDEATEDALPVKRARSTQTEDEIAEQAAEVWHDSRPRFIR
jgi:hypothetical protein